MKRLIKMFFLFLKASLMVLMEYRINFLFGTISTILWVIIAIISISILTYQSSAVGGWNRYELFIVQGVYSLIFGFMYMVFVSNFENLSRMIRKGDLDFVLLRPINHQFLVSIGQFRIYQISRILSGIIIISYSMSKLNISLSPLEILYFCGATFVAIVVVYSLWFMIITTNIWLINLDNLYDLLFQITGTSRYPLVILKHIRPYLVYVLLPLVIITTVPSQVLIKKVNIELLIWGCVLSLVLFIVSNRFWKFALKHYTSASS